MMAKTSKAANAKIEKVMHEYGKGELKSGSGKKVTSQKQAVAIALSEAREKGLKVSPKKSDSKTTTKKLRRNSIKFSRKSFSILFK